MMSRRFAILLAVAISLAQGHPIARADALFSFHSNAWLNLHHILWSKGEGAPLPPDMPEPERSAWAAGIESYAPYSKRRGSSNRRGRTSLDGLPIDSGVRTTLERLMPIYQKHWWPAHDRTNREWTAAVRPLIDRHGAALDHAIARAYDVTEPDNPVWVDVSVRAGPVGAYETGPVTQ